jgi:hypothetical protein
MRKTVVAIAGVCLILGFTGLSWGQAYLDRGLGDAGHVESWQPYSVGKQLISVSCRPGVGARVAYFFPYSNDGVDSEIAFEGILSYMVSSNFATALSVGYTNPTWNDPISGESKLTYLNLTFELRGAPTAEFGFYLGFGPSMIFTDFDSDTDANIRGRDSFGMHLAIGFDYCITQDLVFNIDVKHLWFLEDYKYSVDGGPTEKEKLDSVIMGAGLKYFF